ncbi:MAG: hypothetical protein LC768_05775, partial [Acidobacteria bacterium]|nr:hypothetical protein [Acidobacteriota bacterium]MCA1637832.1 hypothetical protein [Acidobacteriota bacterium]
RVWISSVFSNNGAIKAHCSSVNSSRRAIREVYQTIFEMASKNLCATVVKTFLRNFAFGR